jgi:hypothetical protein
MTSVASGDEVWRAALESAAGDPEGEEIRRSQGLWALAVGTEWPDQDVRCGGDVFGPVLTPGEFVAMRCWVRVEAGDLARTRHACDVAWRRWTGVDEDGFEVGLDLEDPTPDPFGYPDVDGGSVVLAFDARGDEDPFPDRALTCLRILVEELRSHDCTPVRLTNPLRLPDDEGVDVGALADELAAAGEPRPVERPAPPPRPDWLPPFHEVDGAHDGRPDGPVPFVLLADRSALAWDPHRGLLQLPRAEPEADAHHISMDVDSLSADGNRLRYLRFPGTQSEGRAPGTGVLDIRSGAVTFAPASRTEVFDSPAGDLRVEVEGPPAYPRPEQMFSRYRLVDGSGASRDLPLRDPLSSTRFGPAAQFSPTGRLLVTSHGASSGRRYLVCTDVATGQGREHLDWAWLLGNPAWSPDETRLLVQNGNDPVVLDLATGQREGVPVDRLGPDDPGPGLWKPLGWLDDHGLLVSLRHGRRLRLAYQRIDDPVRHHVLDIPVPSSPRNTRGLTLATTLLRESPHLVGHHPRSAEQPVTDRSHPTGR